MTTTENNKLIAEFMGWETHPNMPQKMRIKGIEDGYRKLSDFMFMESMEYHSSWDWLMPVVEKIETTLFEFKNYINNFSELKKCKSSYAWVLTSFDSREEFIGWDVNIQLESLCKEFCSTKGENPKYQTKIEATYNVIVDFIKWYNKQNKIS